MYRFGSGRPVEFEKRAVTGTGAPANKAALLSFGPYEGLQQKIGFDANGDARRVAYFMTVKDGRFVRE